MECGGGGVLDFGDSVPSLVAARAVRCEFGVETVVAAVAFVVKVGRGSLLLKSKGALVSIVSAAWSDDAAGTDDYSQENIQKPVARMSQKRCDHSAGVGIALTFATFTTLKSCRVGLWE